MSTKAAPTKGEDGKPSNGQVVGVQQRSPYGTSRVSNRRPQGKSILLVQGVSPQYAWWMPPTEDILSEMSPTKEGEPMYRKLSGEEKMSVVPDPRYEALECDVADVAARMKQEEDIAMGHIRVRRRTSETGQYTDEEEFERGKPVPLEALAPRE